MIEHHFALDFLLFLTGLLAGTIDAIAGGGGLITLPMLMSVGLPPQIALGTNKLQGSVGTLVAAVNFLRKKLISFNVIKKGLFFSVIGTTGGALTAQIISGALLEDILPVLMILIFLYTLFTPKLGLIEHKERMREPLFFGVFGFGLGFYDGFLGPGTGSFWVMALVVFLGYNMTKATAYTKVFNLNSNIIALLWFVLGNNIDYQIGFIMAAGQLIGGKIGSELVILKGAKLVRPIFLVVVFFTIVVMAYKSYSN